MTVRPSKPNYYSSPSDRSDEERAMREANAALQGGWRPADTKSDLLTLLIVLAALTAFILTQSC